MFKRFRSIGPGALVAAAFIGPGTVTMCSIAGVSFGFELLWALLLATIITVLLQEMAARLGLVGRIGVPGVVNRHAGSSFLRVSGITLILLAIVLGNTAYEAGNISGGAMGLDALGLHLTIDLGSVEVNAMSWLIGGLAFAVLYLGKYRSIERVLIGLVIFMSLAFIAAAVVTSPDLGKLFSGLFRPSIPDGGVWIVVGLIGTTVVPYNIFLHSAAVKERWSGPEKLGAARSDVILSIGLGGLVSMAVVVCGAAVQGARVENTSDLALGLEPLFGTSAKILLGVGLFAAGVTSAITAPLAAAYVAKECFGWNESLTGKRMRLVWAVVLVIGVVFSGVGFKPLTVIQFAQVLNALLLPVVAAILVWAMNRKDVLGGYVNKAWQNIAVSVVLLVMVGLGVKGLLNVFGVI